VAVVRFLSHPQVRVSADIPIPRWGLTDAGRRRIAAVSRKPWLTSVQRLISSDETKALETAAIIAADTGLPIEVRVGLRENDRSATGFVPPSRFEQLADAFFAEPDTSVEGWETSRDAQARVVKATSDLFSKPSGDVLISGHGGVGTLLLCHLLGVPISRDHDQNGPTSAPGGGNHWTFDCDAGRVLHGWRPIEELIPSE
jgi:broad specificity phosphatase PhoE